MIDIDKMSSNEWLDYRDNLLESFYRAGNVLKPTIECRTCDTEEDYTCFECEVSQLNDKGF